MKILFDDNEACERFDYERQCRKDEQPSLFDDWETEALSNPMTPDLFTLLRMFENYRGIDRPQSWLDLLQQYHHAYDDPSDKRSWSAKRLLHVIEEAEAVGYIEATDSQDWLITAKGLKARKKETERRMKA